MRSRPSPARQLAFRGLAGALAAGLLFGMGAADAGPATFRLSVDVGGRGLVGRDGTVWRADAGVLGGVRVSTRAAVTGAADLRLYRSRRDGLTAVRVPRLARGTYRVTLHFAETVATATGQRVQRITSEGVVKRKALDVFREAGRARAYSTSFLTTVRDGRLDLGFQPLAGTTQLAAFRVEAVRPGSARTTPPAPSAPAPSATSPAVPVVAPLPSLPAGTWPAGTGPETDRQGPQPDLTFAVLGRTLHVDASAAPGGTGSAERPLSRLQDALALAGPGDQVMLAAGSYPGPVRTVRPGTASAPILVRGVPGAVLVGRGVDRDRLFSVTHDWVVVAGLTLTNADKGFWVQGASHVRLLHNRVYGTGGECIRIKYRSRENEVAHNLVGPCGLVNFDVAAGRKNGEGVYLGTAPEQLYKNPTPEPDNSGANRVHDNLITAAAECVDVKEASEGNVVERNACSGGLDPDGSGLGSRGNRTVFRFNVVTDQVGKGVRLGGDTPDQGVLNDVYGNALLRTGSYAVGAMRMPQGRVCGNTVGDNARGVVNVALPVTEPCP